MQLQALYAIGGVCVYVRAREKKKERKKTPIFTSRFQDTANSSSGPCGLRITRLPLCPQKPTKCYWKDWDGATLEVALG